MCNQLFLNKNHNRKKAKKILENRLKNQYKIIVEKRQKILEKLVKNQKKAVEKQEKSKETNNRKQVKK